MATSFFKRLGFFSFLILFGIVFGQARAQTGSNTSAVTYYAQFEQDLTKFAKRTDIKVYPVNTTKKTAAINKMKSFAKNFGVDVSAMQADGDGKISKVMKNAAGEVDRYFSYMPPRDTGGIGNEIATIRKTWDKNGGTQNVLSDQSAQSIADQARAQYSLPLVGSGDVVKVGPIRQLRRVQGDEGARTVLRQTVGYYRMLGTRQVINSNFLVDVDNATGTVVGMTLKSWWQLSTAQTTSVKSASQLKDDFAREFVVTAGSAVSVTVDSCQATYYQTKQNVVPAVSCSYRVVEGESTVDAGMVTVSQSTQYSLKLL